MTQNNLGNALRSLGEREAGTARLEESVAAIRAALEERTRDRVPLFWAGTQGNLGAALASLGERETGTARLEEAVAAYRAAQKEQTRDRDPLGWAVIQFNLGIALERIGARIEDPALFHEATDSFEKARTVFVAEGHFMSQDAAAGVERAKAATLVLEARDR